jgi:hypothetical protein
MSNKKNAKKNGSQKKHYSKNAKTKKINLNFKLKKFWKKTKIFGNNKNYNMQRACFRNAEKKKPS